MKTRLSLILLGSVLMATTSLTSPSLAAPAAAAKAQPLTPERVFADPDLSGPKAVGVKLSPDGQLPAIVERPEHPWFIGVQFHPELKSRPFEPHPLFASFVEAAVKQSRLV